jgi:hypothetical protein
MFRKSPKHFFGDLAKNFYGEVTGNNVLAQGLMNMKEKATSGLQRQIAASSRYVNDNIVNLKRKAGGNMPGMEGEPTYKRVPNPGGIDRRKAIGGETYRKSNKYKERFGDTQPGPASTTASQGGFWDTLKSGAGDFLNGVKDQATGFLKEQLMGSIYDLAAL